MSVCVLRSNLPPAFLAEWLGSFTCHCGSTGGGGGGRTPNKSQHTKLTLEKKFLPPLLPGFELATFWSRVRSSYKQAIPAPRIIRAPRVIPKCNQYAREFFFFLSHAKITGEIQWINPCLQTFFFLFFFSNEYQPANISSTLLGQVWIHSGSTSRHDSGRAYPNELRVTSFTLLGPTLCDVPGQHGRLAHTDFVASRMYACLAVTCHLHFGQNYRGLSGAKAVKGVEWSRGG